MSSTLEVCPGLRSLGTGRGAASRRDAQGGAAAMATEPAKDVKGCLATGEGRGGSPGAPVAMETRLPGLTLHIISRD